MNCKECQEVVFEYVDGTLEQTLREQVDLHMAVCPECSIFLEGERNAMADMASVLEPALSQRHLQESVQARIARSASAATVRRTHNDYTGFIYRIRPVLASAAALVLLVGMSTKLWFIAQTENQATHLEKTVVSDNATNEFSRFIHFACFSNKENIFALNTVQMVVCKE